VAFLKATTSLQNVEDRLRRLFGQAGTVGASLDPKVSININAGDLYQPGLSTYKGRRFVWSRQWGGTVAAGLAFGIRFLEAVEIDEIFTSSPQTAGQDWFFSARNTAQAASVFGVPATPAAWAELAQSDTATQGPPLQEAGFAAGEPVQAVVGVHASGLMRLTPVELFIPAGSYLYIQNVGALSGANPWFMIRGRIARVETRAL